MDGDGAYASMLQQGTQDGMQSADAQQSLLQQQQYAYMMQMMMMQQQQMQQQQPEQQGDQQQQQSAQDPQWEQFQQELQQQEQLQQQQAQDPLELLRQKQQQLLLLQQQHQQQQEQEQQQQQQHATDELFQKQEQATDELLQKQEAKGNSFGTPESVAADGGIVKIDMRGLPLSADEHCLADLFESHGLPRHLWSLGDLTITATVNIYSEKIASRVVREFNRVDIEGSSITVCKAGEDLDRNADKDRGLTAKAKERDAREKSKSRDRRRSRSKSRSRSREKERGSNRADDQKTKGTITKFHQDKGFGFIKLDKGGDDIFVHFSQVPREYQRAGQCVLKAGDRVSFDISIDPTHGKPSAKNLTVVSLAEDAPPGAGGEGSSSSKNARKGICKNFNSEKGFGFIKADDGEDMFFHQTVLPLEYQRGGSLSIAPGDRLLFETETDSRTGRSLAKNVKVLGPADPSAADAWGGKPAPKLVVPPPGKGAGAAGGPKVILPMSAARRAELFGNKDSPSPSR
eukprot:gnl/TRDRNA2_/TRDRNA2_176693_c3_seq6.p1 gnl/TRDRNA2_/TRDRNA2_176693_c3~~gnl/TRDRNA2_/TRDRNA2_176693_c3_seq6.p1  ORF type:complete len:534 (-),score=133.05 gnl/TRDRNA2_/TRDRNA2_176693_c3_seq6:238-1782(-)